MPLMEEVRQHIGDGPVYISFDIDAIDPAFCPGTGSVIITNLFISLIFITVFDHSFLCHIF